MAATPASENPVENEFLAMLGGKPYSPDLFPNFEKAHPFLALWHYIEPYNTMFLRLLRGACFSVSDAELIDFEARFTYITGIEDGLHVIKLSKLRPIHIKLFGSGPPGELVGTSRDGSVYNGDRMIARDAGQFNTFHEIGYNNLFGGTLGELISQMPAQFKTSGKSYYYTHYFIEKRYETHHVKIRMLERL